MMVMFRGKVKSCDKPGLFPGLVLQEQFIESLHGQNLPYPSHRTFYKPLVSVSGKAKNVISMALLGD